MKAALKPSKKTGGPYKGLLPTKSFAAQRLTTCLVLSWFQGGLMTMTTTRNSWMTSSRQQVIQENSTLNVKQYEVSWSFTVYCLLLCQQDERGTVYCFTSPKLQLYADYCLLVLFFKNSTSTKNNSKSKNNSTIGEPCLIYCNNCNMYIVHRTYCNYCNILIYYIL